MENCEIMTCCPSGVPPEESIDTVITQSSKIETQVNIQVPPANNGESYEILKECMKEGICRGSRVEIEVQEGAEIIDKGRVTYAIAHSRTSLVGIVGNITEGSITISPAWEEAFKFGSTDYRAGTRTDLGYFDISGKYVLEVHAFR